ncbi:MAG: transketolase [Acidobacteria bacterium]|nr:transketolase [Acidobacteriota bacterium]
MSTSEAERTADRASAVVDAAESRNEKKKRKEKLDELCVNTIRFLAVDAVEKANSGHPGTPMGMADIAYVLWTEFLRHDPKHPDWIGRDRFILSAGHASMLLYSLLHLTGYKEMTLDQLRDFRQWNSKTAGHPEYGHAAGIETTTGPLGQGFANGVGMGLAAKMMAARFNSDENALIDHYVYSICSDGDLMEGVASEAASLAGHLGLGNLIYFYDDNLITIEGETRLAFSEDVGKRFQSYGWQVQKIDGHDRDAIRRAIRKAQREKAKPSLIICRTIIGWGAPNLHGTAEAHGAPLGPEEVRLTKQALGWPLEEFHVPDGVREHFEKKTKKLVRSRRAWDRKMRQWRETNPEMAAMWDGFWKHEMPAGWIDTLVKGVRTSEKSATRSLSGKAIQALSNMVPFLVGGSADLGPSNNTTIKGSQSIARKSVEGPPPDRDVFTGRNLHFGVREHAMGAIVNGMTLAGPWRAYGGTFLIFSDYMRPSIRLAALMNIPSIFVFTHDSIFLGEDGPTHQPVEHLWALRAIPNLHLFRPCSDVETAMAWGWAVVKSSGPTAMAFTRQKLAPVEYPDDFDPETVWKGAYVLRESEGDDPVTLLATGSEVPVAIEAAERLAGRGQPVRIVSAPCLELFDAQKPAYRKRVLGDRSRIVTIEAGSTIGWYRYADDGALHIGVERFGASAPAEVLAEKYGLTADAVVTEIEKWLAAK